MNRVTLITWPLALVLSTIPGWTAEPRNSPELLDIPEIKSSWDDLTENVTTHREWLSRRAQLKQRYLRLIRDSHKPKRPPLDLQTHESTVIDNEYVRHLISYQVEADERAHAYLGIPLNVNAKAKAAGIVALHGTYEFGKQRAAGLIDNPDKAYLDHLCR